MKEARTVIIAVDIQNDFCPGGSLAVAGGHQVVEPMNKIIRAGRENGYLIVLGRDWHTPDSLHFAKNNPESVWPEHCIQGTPGAEFHHCLDLEGGIIISKGMNPKDLNSYSEFSGLTEDGLTLEELLKKHNIKRVLIGGLATDYCVKATAIDAAKAGFSASILEEAIRAVNLNLDEDGNPRGPKLLTDEDLALREMIRAGVKISSVRWESFKAENA